MKKEWYVVNTVSGYEYKVKEKLEMRINSMDLQENTRRLLVKLMMEDQVLEDNIKHKKRRAQKRSLLQKGKK